MSQKRITIALLMLLFALGGIWAKDLTIRRKNSVLRAGPASYHKVLSKLEVGAKVRELNQQGSWLEVEFKNEKGYIPQSALEDKSLSNDPFANVKASTAGSGVSKQSLTAGVKGFAAVFKSEYGLSSSNDFFDLALADQIDPSRYNLFVKNTYEGVNREAYLRAFQIPKNPLPDYFSEAHEGFGLAVAAVIANLGLYDNPAINDYIRYLGQILVEASDAGDIHFRFFVLDISQPNAYACPGGYIFISKGIFQAVASEAELAFVLAHEIAHVTRFHGMLEAKARENQIGAEIAFDELDRELESFTSAKSKRISDELEQEISDIYETLIQGRLDEYEEEADQLALCFMARAGYDPMAGNNLLLKLQATRYESNNQHYRRDSVTQRLDWIKSSLAKYQKSKQKYLDHTLRFYRFKAMPDR